MRKLMCALALIVSAPAMAQSSVGIDIPTHDIVQYCRTAHAQPGKDPRYLVACIKGEQSNLDLITALWPSANDWARRESVRYAAQYRETPAYFTALSSYLESFMRDAEMAQDLEAVSHLKSR